MSLLHEDRRQCIDRETFRRSGKVELSPDRRLHGGSVCIQLKTLISNLPFNDLDAVICWRLTG